MKALLAGVAVAAVLAGPARAADVVVCANCTNELTEAAREAARVVQVAKELATLKAQYDQLVQTYAALAHLPADAVAELSQQFNTPALRSPLPGLDELSAAITGATSAAGALNGLVTQQLQSNRIYTAPGSDFGSLALNGNAASIAGVQASIGQLYQSATQHAQALQTLEGELRSAPDAKATADIQARIEMEKAHLQVRQVQAQSLGTMQAAQVRQTQQQLEESRRCYIDALLNGTDTAQDTCARPASQGAVQIASAGAAGTGAVAGDYQQWVGQSVGSGQCPALVEAAVPSVGLTRTWTQGEQVVGNTNLAVGTPIATFDGSGRYANATDGSSHAALYLGQDGNGNIQVLDQWLGHSASVRTISNGGSTQANNSNAFFVISH